MLNLRIRPVNDDGSTDESTRVIATQQITYTGVFNSVSTISFDVSRDDWQPTAYPFVVRVEYSTGGRYVPLPEHDLFIIERDSDDSKDAGRIVTYQGIAYVPWILTGTYVGVGPWNVDGERTIDNGPANAGRILDYFFTESTSRGPWLKHLDWNFNGTRDSANVLWKTEDREEFAWRVDQHWYGEMLAQLADQSLCEWTVMGTELQLFRPGTRGVDRSETIQLGGPRFDRVPVETDTQGQFTHVISTYDEGRTWTTNTVAEARFGRRSVAASHTGVKTAAGSQRLSQKLLDGGQEVKREEAYEWTPTTGDVSPFRDFSLGDLVSAVSRGAKNSRRVIGVIITQSADEVTVQARVGERISTLAAKNQKALEAVTGGSIPGGTGGVFPTVPPVEKSVPAGPVGLHVVSNTGEFTSVGARATVVLAWSPVTETVTGEEVVITEYALYQDGVEVLRTHNTTVSVEMPSVVSRDFQVVAFAGADRRSDPSATVSVTGALPVAFELDPTPPTLSSSHGNVRAIWDGLYTTAAPAGAHTIRVEARVGSGAWVQQGAALTSGGEQLVSVGAIGDTVQVRFRAYDQLQRLTGTSASASIEVKGVRNGDLDEALQQAVQEGREAKDAAVQNAQDILTLTDEQSQIAAQAQDAWNQALDAMDAAVTGGGNIYPDPSFEYGGAGLNASIIWEIIEDPVNARQGTHVATQTPGRWGTIAGPSEYQPCSGADVAYAEAYVMRTDAAQTGEVRLNIQTLRQDGSVGASRIDSVNLEDIAVGVWHKLSGTIRITTASGESERTGWRVYIYAPSTDSGGFIIDSVRHTNVTQAYEALEAAQAAQDAASQAQSDATEAMTAADGKTRIWRSTLGPASSNAQGNTGDVWWRYSNSNFTGPIIGQWTRSAPGAGGWQPTQIESEVIANLTVDKLVVTGGAKFPTAVIDTLVGDQAFIGSLYTNRVIVDAEDLAPGVGGYESVWDFQGSATTVTSVDPSGRAIALPIVASNASNAYGPMVPVREGAKINYELYALAQSSPNADMNCRIRFYDSSMTLLENIVVERVSSSGWVRHEVTPPSGTRYAMVGFATYLNSTDPTGRWVVRNFNVRPRVGSVLIENGAVTARVMDADEIYADEAHMNVLASGLVTTDEVTGLGNSLNITANESIELAAGRQDATDQQLSELREDVDDNIDATEQAATVADEAHIAALAAGADLVAQNSRLEGVESGLSDQQAHFKILPNGVQVAFDDQSASLDMTPQSIRFMSQGTAVAEISQEAIIIHKGIFEQAQIGNHLMQKRGNRTTFTPIEGS